MHTDIPMVSKKLNNEVIITTSNELIEPRSDIRLVQNSNTNATLPANIQNSNSSHEFFQKYPKEIFIRFRAVECEKRIDILQFHNDTNVGKLLTEKEMSVQRERPVKTDETQDHTTGLGTEFNKNEKWLRKFALNKKKDESKYPIVMAIGNKRYKALKEGMFENSQYCVFIRSSSDTFEAVTLKDWYKMHLQPITKFNKYENVMAELDMLDNKYKGRTRDNILEGEAAENAKQFQIQLAQEISKVPRLMVTAKDNEYEADSSDEEATDIVKKSKRDAIANELLAKQQNEESDEDDHQGDEVDYMSDDSDKSDVSDRDGYNSNNNYVANDVKVDKENDIETNANSESIYISSLMSSLDCCDDDINQISKQQLSFVINKNITNKTKLNPCHQIHILQTKIYEAHRKTCDDITQTS